MKCKWEIVSEPDDNGWHLVQCSRCGYARKSPFGPERNHGDCLAWPLWHEFGHWLGLFLAALGITKHRYGALKRLLGVPAKSGCTPCDSREQKLNTLGTALSTRIHAFLGLLLRLAGRVRQQLLPQDGHVRGGRNPNTDVVGRAHAQDLDHHRTTNDDPLSDLP